jgi:hypothetical protein
MDDRNQKIKGIQSLLYPQVRDKFFRITKNSFSFVRPPYPSRHGISAGQIRASLLEFIGAGNRS